MSKSSTITKPAYGGPAIHPGVILTEEFLLPMGVTPYAMAKAIGKAPNYVTLIANGKRNITVESALLFGKFFGMTPDFWLNLQRLHDLRRALADKRVTAALGKVVAATSKKFAPAKPGRRPSALKAA